MLPTLTDQSITEQLSFTSHQLNSDLNDLRSAVNRAKPACQGLGLDGPSQLIEDLQEELKEFEKAVEAARLRPLPGDSAEKGARQLISSSKIINQGVETHFFPTENRCLQLLVLASGGAVVKRDITRKRNVQLSSG